MAGRLTRGALGAWLFTANPANPAVRFALGGNGTLDERCVRRTYRAELMQPGDVVLWVSGPRHAKATPGIWMVGHVTGRLHEHKAAPGDPRHSVRVELRLLEQPLSRELLAADRRTASMEVLRQPWTANPSYLTSAEWAAVEALLAKPLAG